MNRWRSFSRVPEACRLCGAAGSTAFASVKGRDYLHCSACDLVFVARQHLPSRDEERAEYELHNNDPADAGYRRHLQRLTGPLEAHLKPGQRGLDFGCGPGPAISVLLAEDGFEVADYDPVFYPNRALLAARYDFITSSEVVEHFHEPGREFKLLDGLMRRPGAILAIMTLLRQSDSAFEDWYYIREISHVAFYSERCFAWLARKFDWTMSVHLPNVVIFRN